MSSLMSPEASDSMSEEHPLRGVSALVLGAGFGTRLKPLTENVPKPGIPLLGRPLIGHPLIHLYNAGCTDIHVNAFHQAQRLMLTLAITAGVLALALVWAPRKPRLLSSVR